MEKEYTADRQSGRGRRMAQEEAAEARRLAIEGGCEDVGFVEVWKGTWAFHDPRTGHTRIRTERPAPLESKAAIAGVNL